MKLYTEEQLQEAYNRGYMDGGLNNVDYSITDGFKPIELPSDEEIELYLKSFPYTKHLDDGQYNDGAIVGAELAIEWMKCKILNQNK